VGFRGFSEIVRGCAALIELCSPTAPCQKAWHEWKLIFISKTSHLDSLWNRGSCELGNGLLVELSTSNLWLKAITLSRISCVWQKYLIFLYGDSLFFHVFHYFKFLLFHVFLHSLSILSKKQKLLFTTCMYWIASFKTAVNFQKHISSQFQTSEFVVMLWSNISQSSYKWTPLRPWHCVYLNKGPTTFSCEISECKD